MRDDADNPVAAAGTVVLHVAALALMWLSGWIRNTGDLRAPGPMVEATIEFDASDLRAAHAAAAAAVPPPPPPQRVEQPKPQAPQDVPDTEDQERIVEVAPEASDQPQVQEEKTRQDQVDLTQDIERQKEAENRERLREQLEEIRRQREQAEQRTRMEEQKLAQLADRALPPAPKPGPPGPPATQSGAGGTDTGLRARYIAALNATARDNWNPGLAPELTRCRVRFTQIPGGEVINVEFMDCPYDAQGRESVERALRKTPMPYSGFEPVFERSIVLTFCYPEEACPNDP